MQEKENYSFDDFKKIMEILIGENGCPWDKIQTHESLKRYLIEECYEVIDAIDNNDEENLREELGDVLLQVFFHSIIAEKNREFSLNDVINGICGKMICRHPHIFSNECAETADDVLLNWEEIKKKEKGYKNQSDVLKSVPKSLPALIRAEKVIKKALSEDMKQYSFKSSIDNVKNLIDSIDSEKSRNNSDLESTIGELLFLTVNISQFLKINPEFALTNATEKFINRFVSVESMPKADDYRQST